MSEQARGSTTQAFVSGGVVLLTGPLTLALIMLFGARDEDGAGSGLARLIQEGGGFSFAVLALGATATVAAAVLTGVSVRRPGLPGSMALVPFVLPMLAALLGVIAGAKTIADVLGSVNPLDRPIILVVGSGELASLLVQALAFAAGGALAVTAASLVALAAPGRGARALTAAGSFVLGLAFVAALLQSSALHSHFTAVGSGNPADRMTLFAAAVGSWTDLGRFTNFLSLGALVLAGVAGAVLAARGDRGAAMGTAAGILVTLVGVRGFDALAVRRMFVSLDEVPAPAQVSITLRGIAPRSSSSIRLPSSGALKDQIADTLSMRGDSPFVGFELPAKPQRAEVLEALTLAHGSNAEVELVGQPPPNDAIDELPRQFRAAAKLLASQPQAVPVKVLFDDEVCEACKQSAKLSGDTLLVGDETWEAKYVGEAYGLERYEPVEFDWREGTPEDLVKAASIALANEHVLTVRVPAP